MEGADATSFLRKKKKYSSRRNIYKRTDDSVCNVKSAAQIDKALAHCHCKREIVVDGHEMVVWTKRKCGKKEGCAGLELFSSRIARHGCNGRG